jgi:FtsH-binding integral membrane protein
MDFNNNFGQFTGQEVTNEGYGVAFENPFVKNESTILSRSFTWMAIGLGISAISALLGYNYFLQTIASLYIPLIIIELILVLAMSFGIKKMSDTVAKICFIAYSVVNGVTLSSIFVVYTSASIYSTFFVTAAMFGAAAFYGKVTNKDLSSWGTFLLMGLVGLIIAGIVNIFIGNSMLEFFISLIGIVIFIGLTAYDVYKIKNYANDYPYIQDNSAEKISVFFALQLYLDFINIFLKLLRFMGKRKN